MSPYVPLLLLGLVCSPALGARLPFIINGDSVRDATRWPWQGSLQVYGSHNCGCSLISNTWAVTAAHCVSSPASATKVRFGTYQWRYGGQLRQVSTIIEHERWGSGAGSFPNDIAVMKFPAVTLGSTVKTIQMATTDQAHNSDCWITGWGYTTVGYKTLPEILQQAKITVYTQTECKQKWGSSYINDGHVCVGGNSRGACNGDSGGPLVCRVGGQYQLVGVTSWVLSGCYTSRPSVYTRVSYFRDWVRGKTGIY